LRERGSGTKGARTEQGNSKEKEGRAKAPSQYINGAEAIKAYRMAKEGRSEGGRWPVEGGGKGGGQKNVEVGWWLKEELRTGKPECNKLTWLTGKILGIEAS
jgi:hypothetical protein